MQPCLTKLLNSRGKHDRSCKQKLRFLWLRAHPCWREQQYTSTIATEPFKLSWVKRRHSFLNSCSELAIHPLPFLQTGNTVLPKFPRKSWTGTALGWTIQRAPLHPRRNGATILFGCWKSKHFIGCWKCRHSIIFLDARSKSPRFIYNKNVR